MAIPTIPTSQGTQARRARILNGVLICCACVCLGLMSLYFSAGSYGLSLFRYYLTQPMVLALNILPYLLIFLIVFFLTGRSWIGFAVTGVVTLVYSWAQYWKLMARSDAVYAEDLLVISEAMQMSGKYISVTWQIVLSAVLVLLGTLVFSLLRRVVPSKRSRVAGCVLAVLVSVVSYQGLLSADSVYSAIPCWDRLDPWIQTNQYISRGGIYPFLYSVQSALPSKPEGYDAHQAKDILSQYESDDIPQERQVSVIAVMYEAFSDLSKYTDRITTNDPYEAFHQLQSESYHGELVTNIFAGGTVNTERCVLTGFSELTSLRRAAWSYARYFARQGYQVSGAHAGNQGFYSRSTVNANLGLEEYRFIENYYETLTGKATPPADAIFLPDLVSWCEEQMENGPVFSFNVTYQNHGSYSGTDCWFAKEYVPRGDMDESDYLIVNNYLVGIEDTCNRMLAMADAFRDSDEPVILLFFGDHKPWLGNQSSTYAALGIDFASQSEESFYNYYTTEYTIWANAAAQAVLGEEFQGTGPTVSPCFLMNVLFDKCGWEGPGYQKLTDQVMACMPVVHTTGRCQMDGTLLYEQELPQEAQALLWKMKYAQFYLAQDARGIHP